MNRILTAVAVAAVLVFGATVASASTTTAFGSGWITDSNYDNSGGSFGAGIHNNYAGLEGGVFRDWFEFNLPTTAFTAATLNIFNSAANTTNDLEATFSLYAVTGFSFDGLVSGFSLGTVDLADADDGPEHYVSISLNSLGIDYLNAHLGGIIRFGGAVTTSTAPTCSDCVGIFGATDGTPAAQLIGSNVPEPASWALMIAGFGLVGAAARRHRRVTV